MMKIFLLFVVGIMSIQNFSMTKENRALTMSELMQILGTKDAKVSFCVLDENKKVLASYHEDDLMAPRSIVKMMTTAVALDTFGDNYTFKTQVMIQGDIIGETLEGSLVIIGGGDPTFGSKRSKWNDRKVFQEIINALRLKKIQSIDGDLIVDVSRFETALANRFWELEDIGNYYGAGSAGLNFNENYYTIAFDTNSDLHDAARIVDIFPKIQGLEIKNEVKIASSETGDEAYVFGGEYVYLQTVRGTLPKRKERQFIKAVIPNPPLFFLQQLRGALIEAGIKVKGKLLTSEVSIKRDTLKSLYTFESEPLIAIIHETHKNSINLFTEALVKQMGFHVFGFGSTDNGIKVMEEYLRKRSLSKGCLLKDGSGLTLRNLMTTNLFCNFLLSMQSSPFYQKWKETLLSESQIQIFPFPQDIKGKFFIKTGSSKHIKAIAGYYLPPSGKERVFCFVIDYPEVETKDIRTLLEAFIALLVKL